MKAEDSQETLRLRVNLSSAAPYGADVALQVTQEKETPVSYTHLTLPTIYSV